MAEQDGIGCRGQPTVMQDRSQDVRAGTAEALFGRISRATPHEARDLSLSLTPLERAEMALFCFNRTHTREQGRAIASACARGDMVKAGGQAGAFLYDQVGDKTDTWGASAAPVKKSISLAGRGTYPRLDAVTPS